MLKTIYLFELKKVFFSRVNMIAMAGVVVIVIFLAVSSVSQDQPAFRESAKELDGRTVDELLFEEVKPALEDVNGLAILQLKEGYEKYAPVLRMIRPVCGDEFDFSRFQSIGFYELRRQRILQRMEKQELSDAERAYWEAMEEEVKKPFTYHYHSGPANLLRSFQALGFFVLLLSAV